MTQNSSEVPEAKSVALPFWLTLAVVLVMGLSRMGTGVSSSFGFFGVAWFVGVGLATWSVIRFARSETPKGQLTPAKKVGVTTLQVLSIVIVLLFLGALVPVVGGFFESAYLVLAPTLLPLLVWLMVAFIRGRRARKV